MGKETLIADMLWRDSVAGRILDDHVVVKTSGAWLVTETRSKFWGWLYFGEDALLFICDEPIYARDVLTEHPRIQGAGAERLVYLPYVDLGSAKLTAPWGTPNGTVKFATGWEFLGQKKYMKAFDRFYRSHIPCQPNGVRDWTLPEVGVSSRESGVDAVRFLRYPQRAGSGDTSDERIDRLTAKRYYESALKTLELVQPEDDQERIEIFYPGECEYADFSGDAQIGPWRKCFVYIGLTKMSVANPTDPTHPFREHVFGGNGFFGFFLLDERARTVDVHPSPSLPEHHIYKGGSELLVKGTEIAMLAHSEGVSAALERLRKITGA